MDFYFRPVQPNRLTISLGIAGLLEKIEACERAAANGLMMIGHFSECDQEMMRLRRRSWRMKISGHLLVCPILFFLINSHSAPTTTTVGFQSDQKLQFVNHIKMGIISMRQARTHAFGLRKYLHFALEGTRSFCSEEVNFITNWLNKLCSAGSSIVNE